jgi:hypothetical protein
MTYAGNALKKHRSKTYMAIAALVIIALVLIAYSLACPTIHAAIDKEDADRRVIVNIKAYQAGIVAGMELAAAK